MNQALDFSMSQDWTHEGLALHRAGRLAEAEVLYARALAADSDCCPAHHLMGLI
jgi:Flp pilus assembly protein TadD